MDASGERADADRRQSWGPGLNRVELIGRLVADPEMRCTPAGALVTSVRLATNWQGRPEYHRLVAFGSVAEFAGQYLSTGRLVFADGRLQTREWTDGDGVKRWTTEVVVNSLQALDSRRRDDAEAAEADREAG